MKTLIAVALIGSVLVTSAQANERASAVELTRAQQKIDLVGAVVRSPEQLDAYLASGTDTALHTLGTEKMRTFLDSLTFSGTGLGSFSSIELEGLPTSDVYRILAVFGLQSSTGAIPGRRQVNDDDRLINAYVARFSPRIKKNHSCIMSPGQLHGRCVKDPGRNCSTACER